LASSTIFFHLTDEFLGGFSTIFFYRVGLLALCPTPTLEDQALYLYPPEAGWPSYTSIKFNFSFMYSRDYNGQIQPKNESIQELLM
jgi:hypothetical protein